MDPFPNLVNLTLVLSAYLGFRKRGLVLIPTLLAPPLFFVVAELLLVPGTAGTATFHNEYSDFFQTAAAVIASLLVVIAVELKFASRESRLATGEAGVIAVAWIGVAEVAAIRGSARRSQRRSIAGRSASPSAGESPAWSP